MAISNNLFQILSKIESKKLELSTNPSVFVIPR